MTEAGAPVLARPTSVQAYLISPADTVKLAVLAGPRTGSATTVVFEVWEPGGSQPPNSHEASSETFVVLAGNGTAYSDEHVVDIGPGDTLTLMPESTHRIVNTSSTERLYTLTIMASDEGFAQLIESGTPVDLDEADLRVLGGRRR